MKEPGKENLYIKHIRNILGRKVISFRPTVEWRISTTLQTFEALKPAVAPCLTRGLANLGTGTTEKSQTPHQVRGDDRGKV